MKMRCVAPYANGPRGLVFHVGKEFEATPQLRLFLLADGANCFEDVPDAPSVKALDEPPADKAVRAPRAKK
jgi:hypothetical protein